MTIKAVLFDLDDTLLWDDRSIKESFEATCKLAAAKYDIHPEQLEESVRREARALYESYETFPFTQMIGINPFEALWGNFLKGENENFRKLRELAPSYRVESWTRGLKALQINDTELGKMLADQFPQERRSRPILYEETIEILTALKRKYSLLLLTNGSPDLQQEKLEGVKQIVPFFDHIIISGEFGEGKPAKSIFNFAMDKLKIQASEGVMVGDKLTTDILGAVSVGMKSIWINRHQIQRSNEIIPDYEISHLSEIQGIIDSIC